jgi:hypothetical protein
MISAALAIGLFVVGCRSNRQGNLQNDERGQAKFVTLDLRFTSPLGHEFCAGESAQGDSANPRKLPHNDLNLTVQLPRKIELPPEASPEKEIVFRPGQHDVDVYKHLDSGSLIAARGTITMESDTPVLRVRLDMSKWPPGRYVVGISGDPLFGYCTMDFE